MYDFLSSKLNQDMAIMIFDKVRISMQNDIESLWKICYDLRIKILNTEYNAIQPLRFDITFDRIATRFGIVSNMEIDQAKTHANKIHLIFKEIPQHVDIISLNCAYIKVVDAINEVMDIMEEKHKIFLSIANSHKDRNQ